MTHATLRRIAALSLAAFATASCATAPGKVATIGQPKTPVARTITNFSHAKRCMDRLFAENGRRGLLITADEIPDATQSVSVGARDMVISALSDMSLHSGAFDFFTVEPASGAIVTLQEQFSPLNRLDAARVPRVYIRGSISQSDNNVATDGAQASVTLPNVSLGVGRNQAAGTISIDLQIARLASRTIVPGVTASNTITIVSSDESQSARGLINGGSFGAGLSVSLGSSEREGRGQAVRTLMDYSLIELVGKWTKVPYQRCLELPSTDPAVMQTARERYDDLDPEARTRAVQIALAATGEYAGPANGVMSPELQDAVTAAKARRDLVQNGRIDFQLFNALYEENALPDRIVARPERDPALAPPPAPGPAPAAGRDPIGLSLRLEDPELRIGDPVRFLVSVTQPSKVYCYYEYLKDRTLTTARIFPNRFQTDNRLEPGQTLTVPRPGDPFRIVLSSTNEEAVACVGTQIDYAGPARLPILDQPDLAPLQGEWPGVAYPIYKHQEVDRLRTSAKKITFRAAQP